MSAWDDAEREIDAEFEFHVAEATDELVATGVPREEARERALARIGNIERWRAECLRIRRGRRTMLVKLQWAAIAALVLALGFLGSRWNRASEVQELELASLRAELAAERTAHEGLRLVDQTALVLQRRLRSVGLNASVTRRFLDSPVLRLEGELRRDHSDFQLPRLQLQLTPEPEIVIEESSPPAVPASDGKPDDQR